MKSSTRNSIITVCFFAIALTFFYLGAYQGKKEAKAIEADMETIMQASYDAGFSDAQEGGYNDGYDHGYDDGYDDCEELMIKYLEVAASVTDDLQRSVSTYFKDASWYSRNACVVTTAGERYHHYDCFHIQNRSFYVYNINLAEARGYTKCLDCWDDGLLYVYALPLQIARWDEIQTYFQID